MTESEFTFRDLPWLVATPFEKFEMLVQGYWLEALIGIFSGFTAFYLSLHLYWAWAAGRLPIHV